MANTPSIDDYADIMRGVAAVTLSWASIEDDLTILLAGMIGERGNEKMELASAILFAPTSLDARITIVDRAFGAVVEAMPRKEEIKPIWRRFIRRLDRQKRIRNRVAHGQLNSFTFGEPPNERKTYRLTAPYFDFQRQSKTKDGMPDGLTASDLDQSVEQLHELLMDVGKFVTLHRAWKFAPNGRAYSETLQKLLDQAQSDSRQRSQATEEPPNSPEP